MFRSPVLRFSRSLNFSSFTPQKPSLGRRLLPVSSEKPRFRSSRNFYTNDTASFFPSATRWNFSFGLALVGAFGLGYLFSQGDEDSQKKAQASSQPPSPALAQSTVVTGTHPHGAFVTIYLSPQANLKAIAKAASNVPNLISEVTPDDDSKKSGQLPAVMAGIAFSTHKWEEVCKQIKLAKPSSGFGHFNYKSGDLGDMPATGGDLLLHVKAETRSQCFELVTKFVKSLPPGSVAKVEDRYAFQFQDGRDLSGFLDGTENPGDDLSRRDAALLPNGGSYIIHQRWIHNLNYLHSKPQEEQEAIIGRTKEDSAEYPRDQMKKSAHVARMRDESFNKIPIVRQSMPFGDSNEHGLLFIAYSNSVSKFDQMLDQMVGKRNGTESDATMSFSRCVASNYYYSPSMKELSSLA